MAGRPCSSSATSYWARSNINDPGIPIGTNQTTEIQLTTAATGTTLDGNGYIVIGTPGVYICIAEIRIQIASLIGVEISWGIVNSLSQRIISDELTAGLSSAETQTPATATSILNLPAGTRLRGFVRLPLISGTQRLRGISLGVTKVADPITNWPAVLALTP